jgi:SM-20-related protein
MSSKTGNYVQYFDDLVSEPLRNQLNDLTRSPIWAYGWRSNLNDDKFCYWHSHFAGTLEGRTNCEDEFKDEPLLLPVYELWKVLKGSFLEDHEPVRVYANAHTFGVEGYVHRDHSDTENYFSTIYYGHSRWDKNWAGETVFFSESGEDIVEAVYPKPGRVVSFGGSIPHCARAPSRDCPELRVSIVFKTQRRNHVSTRSGS